MEVAVVVNTGIQPTRWRIAAGIVFAVAGALLRRLRDGLARVFQHSTALTRSI